MKLLSRSHPGISFLVPIVGQYSSVFGLPSDEWPSGAVPLTIVAVIAEQIAIAVVKRDSSFSSQMHRKEHSRCQANFSPASIEKGDYRGVSLPLILPVVCE